jgi:hypothetical protein
MPNESVGLKSVRLKDEQLMEAYPLALSWTLAIDGRRVGTVQSYRPEEFFYRHDVGIQLLTSSQKFPQIHKNRKEFESWMGTPVFRPIVAVSQPNYSDPDRWKPFYLTPEIARKAYSSFRSVVGIQVDCGIETIRHDYSDKLILPRKKAYRSANGDILLELGTSHTCNPGGPREEWEDPVWFLLHDGTARDIGRSLTLVDAGDYDGDGTSEVVFQYAGYNRDGYVLLHNHLTQVAQFTWGYH